MILLDGKATSQKILDRLKGDISQIKSPPRLDMIIAGHDPASLKYVALKQKKALEIGISGQIIQTDDPESEIMRLNADPQVTGLMVQLPLPSQYDTQKVLSLIDPLKDADGLSPVNLGKLFAKDLTAIAPATPLGIMKLLEEYKIDPSGKNAVIIGRSPIVGLPLLALLSHANATVTLCHSHTKDLKSVCQQADILIVAIGKSKYITSGMVKEGAIVIDVGTNYDAAGKLTGDVDFENVSPKCSYITPVPGGVGPMTISALLQNTLKLSINS